MNSPKPEASARSTEAQPAASPNSSVAESNDLTPEFLQAAESGNLEEFMAGQGGATPAEKPTAPAPENAETTSAASEAESEKTATEAAAEGQVQPESTEATTPETPEQPEQTEEEETETGEAPKRIRLDSEKFSDVERRATQLVKMGVFKNLRSALDHLENLSKPEAPAATTPAADAPALPEKSALDEANTQIESITAQLIEATKLADFEKQGALLTELNKANRAAAKAERDLERAQETVSTRARADELSVARSIEEYPDAANPESLLRMTAAGLFAQMKPNDPLRSDPDRAFKVTQKAAKLLGLKGKSEATQPNPAPAKVPQPKKPAPVPGSARTVVPTTKPEEDYAKGLRSAVGEDEAEIAAIFASA